MSELQEIAGALRIEQFIGRVDELNCIIDSIRVVGKSRIICIHGDGGVGKSRLLEAVPGIVAKEEKDYPCRYIGPFDLYDSSMQNSSNLETAIKKALDPDDHGFCAYEAAQKRYEELHTSGSDLEETKKLRSEAERRFVEGFNQISAQARVILSFDTIEAIQYESDRVQEICNIELTGTETKSWLLKNILDFENTVVILAGRKKAHLLADFRRHFGDRMIELPLEPFNEEDALAYFAAAAEAIPALGQMGLPVDQQRVICHYSNGFPLKLALVIELLIRNLALPNEFFDPWAKACQKDATELFDIQQRVEVELVEGLMTAGDDIAIALPYIALARKGVDRDLLCRLTGWSAKKSVQVMEQLRRFSFVKTRPNSEWLFLHDEMYDLMDRHILNRMMLEKEEICRIIIAYYETKVTQSINTLERQNLLLEQLYYQFLMHPREGYAHYALQSDIALHDHDISFDLRLRDEMLRFCAKYPEIAKSYGLSRDFIDYDTAVRWVKRYRYTSKYEECVKVATLVKARLNPQTDESLSFWLAAAELNVHHALALIYTGLAEQGIAMLKATITDIEDNAQSEIQTEQDGPDTFDTWRRNLILGLAHNNLGYVYWMDLGHYKESLKEFQLALPCFIASNLQEEIANTCDNMGRVYALLGERNRAELLIRDGLELRRRLGREFRIGLSLNSQAILYLLFGDPHSAQRVSEQALKIFENMGAQRGIGSACIKLGLSLRKMGTLWAANVYSIAECEKFIDGSINYLERAVDIFSNVVIEPVRLIEAYNELGCTYREYANLMYRKGIEPNLLAEIRESAIENLNRAIALAKSRKHPELYMDSFEDLAQVYFHSLDLQETEHVLDGAEEIILEEYKIQKDQGWLDDPTGKCGEEFWWQMGKIEILRGHLVFQQEVQHEEKISRTVLEHAIQHYAIASAYFKRCSLKAPGLRAIFEQLYGYFKLCRREDLRYAQNHILPAIAQSDKFDRAGFAELFDEILALAIQTLV
ncbi:MAG: tetratricopeptide repeat protein [Chloroflexota bacterium]